jgi:hypothetical protein
MPGNNLSVDAAELASLHDQIARLDALARRRARQLRALLVAAAALLGLGVCVESGFTRLQQQLTSCRTRLLESRQESSAIAGADGSTRHVASGGPHGRSRDLERSLRRGSSDVISDASSCCVTARASSAAPT